MKKRFLTLGVIALGATSFLTACGGRVIDDQEDLTKANLSIGTYDGGIGSAWLEEAAMRFAKLMENEELQPGRKGVKITVASSKNYVGTELQNNGGDKDIYFVEAFDYYAVRNGGKFLNIADIMTEPIGYNDDNKTIVSKIPAEYRDFMDLNGEFYGIPFYDAFYGMVYDLDAWKENSFYLGTDGDFHDGTDATILTTGPDGVANTYDDGLPATFAEYRTMLNRIVDCSYLPFQYPLNNGIDYTASFPLNIWANQEGKEQMKLNYSFSGTATNLVDIADTGAATPLADTEINEKNGYLLHKQRGLYDAINFVKSVMCVDKNYSQGTSTHLVAQEDFVLSADDSSSFKVAMLCDGSWWENEAAPQFKKLGSIDRHNYAIMPMPFASTNDIGRNQTILSLSGSYGVINKNVLNNGHEKVAKEFMKFLHSDLELQTFTTRTNMTRPLEYEMTAEQEASLSTYTKSILNLKRNTKIDIVYPYSAFRGVISDYGNLGTFAWAFNTGQTKNPFVAFSGTATYTAPQYFNDVNAFFKDYWTKKGYDK